jgi:ABC-type multidrug transport system ATPase subunit
MREKYLPFVVKNDADKTTLINMICGITKINSESVEIFGYDNVVNL